MEIDIIGAGIGGLTTGIALKKKGYKVRVFEKASILKPVGSGIILANNAMQVYQKLNLSNVIMSHGCPVSSICIVDGEFKNISTTSLIDFEKKYQLKNTAIHRGILQQVLLKEFNDDELFLDHELKTIKQNGQDYNLEFVNGNKYVSNVLIGADGIHSKVRDLLFNPIKKRNANQICWRGVVNYNLAKKYSNKAVEAWGKNSRFGFVKIDDDKLYWYALKSLNNKDKNCTDLDKEYFKSFGKLVLEILNKTPQENIHTSEIVDIVPFINWSLGNVCLVGDAAHATTPNLGQGACQAIEDAYVIAECLQLNIPSEAFQKFEKLRRKKVHQIVKTSYKLGEISHLSNPILIFLRNNLMRLVPTSLNKKQMNWVFKLSNTKEV